MGYKIPDWKKSINQDRFEVEAGDQKFSMPKAEYITGAQAQRLANADNIEGGIYAVLDEFCDGLGTALADVPVKYVRELVEAWQEDSGVGLGESEGSSN